MIPGRTLSPTEGRTTGLCQYSLHVLAEPSADCRVNGGGIDASRHRQRDVALQKGPGLWSTAYRRYGGIALDRPWAGTVPLGQLRIDPETADDMWSRRAIDLVDKHHVRVGQGDLLLQ